MQNPQSILDIIRKGSASHQFRPVPNPEVSGLDRHAGSSGSILVGVTCVVLPPQVSLEFVPEFQLLVIDMITRMLTRECVVR